MEDVFFFNDENIRVVYVYEDVENKVAYVGTTKNLRVRHISHNAKSKGKYNALKTYFLNIGKELPTPQILSENLSKVESQEMEEFWVEEYKKNGWHLLNKAKTGFIHSSLGHDGYNDEEKYEFCKKVCKNIKNRHELMRKYYGLYLFALKNGWLDELVGESERRHKNYWTYENCEKAAKECSGREEFFNKYPRAHWLSMRNGWIDKWFPPIKKTTRVKKIEKVARNEAIKSKVDFSLTLRENAELLGVPKSTLFRLAKKWFPDETFSKKC